MTSADTDSIRARIGDRRVIASVSGGKDSTAMCLHLRELGIPYEPVFLDTGWENAETYRYLREELPAHIGEIRWLRSEVTLPPDLEAVAQLFEIRLGWYSPMVRWILKKGMFPSGNRRFCTTELKVRPMAKYLDSLDSDVVNAVGIRHEESGERAKMPEWQDAPEDGLIAAEVWRPIVRFTLDDVIEIHRRHGVTPNRGYLKSARRIGCWPCIRAAKKEIRAIADNDPDRIDIVRDLETIVTARAEARAEAMGLTLAERGYLIPAWFQAPLGREDGRWPTWPIDKVVEWSRTAHGGRQIELFTARDHETGCMRWGMCDVAGRDDDAAS